ncbi:MAG: dihydrolipoyllysine-residue succinyltransferase [Actinobacteria bacterium]|nr:dihydrolipoyllysine-residue succinyltransferase [Actinomycetota bacterium]
MKKEIIIPEAGESVTEADIVSWYKANGEVVAVDEPIVELETDKASMDLVAEIAGTLTINVDSGTVNVGDVVGFIQGGVQAATQETQQTSSEGSEKEKAPKEDSESKAVEATSTVASTSEAHYAKGHPSPAAEKRMKDENIDPKDITGTGPGGRITKTDVLSSAAPKPAAKESSDSEGTQRREKLTRIRKTIMGRMIDAQQTTAMLTTFNEVDMSEVMSIRKKYKDMFKEKHQVGLGFMSFFTKAVCQSLQEHPILNAQVEGDEIVYSDHCDIGIAVATPKGLVVPVVRQAEQLSFVEIEQTILGLAKKGRDGKLTIDDMQGGTFTITNGGVFGSMLSTPILNRPQSAILGMHNIVERPMAVNGQVEIRPIMYLAVTYDHRIIDGSDAVQFLVKIKQLIEDPSRLLVGI